MCGIIGILCSDKIDMYQELLKSLIQLENRGYDSSGICYIDDTTENFMITKYASTNDETSIHKLKQNEKNEKLHLGIGHNRWATHGGKTDMNAHPHVSYNKIFAIVHNGIIENYFMLKDFIKKEINIDLKTDTDTEIIVYLIEYFFEQEKDDISLSQKIHNAIFHTISKLEGTFALIIMYHKLPKCVWCVKRGSPLLLGYDSEKVYISSEISEDSKIE
jgi:glucosamine--fructose-6-phosphate aminotransferase (isomerizing)